MSDINIERVVPLMLNVSDIQPYDINNIIFPYDVIVSNKVGSIQNCVSNVTWNIDLEALLGDLYHRYEYFNIELIQFITVPLTGGGYKTYKAMNNADVVGYRNLNIFMSGLDFVNSTFNQKSGCNKAFAHIGNISNQFKMADNDPNGSGLWRGDEYLYSTQKGYSNYNLLFKKQKNVKINIRFGAIDSNLDYIPSEAFELSESFYVMHHFICKFNIVPYK
jgi:hypothetical protein